MRYKKFFDWTKIPVIGFWTYWIWWDLEPDYSKDSFYIDLIKKAIFLWYSHIDTAEWYAKWHTEELIWEAIKDLNRKNLFITSKVSQENLSYNNLINSCNNSLKRLDTNYLDLYLLHWYNKDLNLENTVKALKYLKKVWKIKNYWVSNFSVDDLKEIMKYTNEIVANQIEYNYFTRNVWQYNKDLEKIVDFCKANNILIIAYRPLWWWRLISKKSPKFLLEWLIKQKNVVTIVWSKNLVHLKENLFLTKKYKKV